MSDSKISWTTKTWSHRTGRKLLRALFWYSASFVLDRVPVPLAWWRAAFLKCEDALEAVHGVTRAQPDPEWDRIGVVR